jgi:hypothetical protein
VLPEALSGFTAIAIVVTTISGVCCIKTPVRITTRGAVGCKVQVETNLCNTRTRGNQANRATPSKTPTYSAHFHLYCYFFDLWSIRKLFGMARRRCSRPLGVEPGPVEACSEGGPAAARTL